MARTKGAGGLSNTKKAQILAAKNVNLCKTSEKIAEHFDVSVSTVNQIEVLSSDETKELAAQYERELLERMKSTSMQALIHASKNIHKLGAKDAVIAFATLYDKIRLEEGKPTSINQQANATDRDTMFALVSVKELMDIHGYSYEEAVRFFFDQALPELAPLQETVTQKLLAEGKQ